MNKVIRDARISEDPIRIDELDRHLAEQTAGMKQDPDAISFSELSTDLTAQPAPPVEEAEDEEAAAVAEPGEDTEGAEPDAEGEAAQPDAGEESGAPEPEVEQPEPEQEPEPGAAESFSALQVESMVEERLKEFEQRFQTEKEEAYRSGFDDGKMEGLKEGQEQSRQEIDQFAKLADDLTRQWQDMYRNTDLSAVDLAMAAAKRIVGASVEHLEAPVLQAVQDCLGYLEDKARVVLKVNPEDLAVVRRHRSDWLESLEGLEQLLIEGDEAISRGGCIVETPKGDVDGQIEERLERLRGALAEAIRTQEESE